jgi:hypothetical protein
MRAHRLLPLVLLASGALGLAACGGSDTPKADTSPGSAVNPLVAREQLTGVPSGKHAAAVERKAAEKIKHPGAIGGGKKITDDQGGGGAAKAPRMNEGATVGTPDVKPGYQSLVDQQTAKPQERFTPCSLVSRSRAQAILGVSVQAPLEAPQGPTCLYRTTRSRGLITLAVQHQRYAQLASKLVNRKRIDVAGRNAVCGSLGRPTVLVQLTAGRVLNVNGPCNLGKRFAAEAVQHLD